MISTVLRMLRMTETSLGWHQVGCSRCVDQRWRTTCHQMKSAYAARVASHYRGQLISFLDVGRRLDDRTLPVGEKELAYLGSVSQVVVSVGSVDGLTEPNT